jgi:penicillin-binding protein 1A
VERDVLAELPDDLTAFRAYRPQTTVTIHAADGAAVDEFFLERRVWVDLVELPPHIGDAFVAAEDRRFWEHEGVDIPGILRAIWVNLEAGEVRQGGSTLTQQLVKNLLVGGEKSYRRKIAEAVLAWRLERELSKDQILELYLNYVYLGSGNYGVEAAALDYFGVSASEIDAGQAAQLAGLIPAPSRYSPRVSPELAAARRDLVLGLMVEQGYLTADQAEELREAAVAIRPRRGSERRVGTAYVTQVRREVRRLMPGYTPFEAGLSVYTPLDLAAQAEAEAAIREAVDALVARQGRQPLRQGSLDDHRREAPGLPRDAAGAPQRPEPGRCFDAMVDRGRSLQRLFSGPHTFALHPADHAARVRDLTGEDPSRQLRQVVRPGDLLPVCVDPQGAIRLAPEEPWAEGAAVAIAHDTGRVVALVGGYDVELEGFLRATQARRQPGSAFKPFIYAAALQQGRSQLDIVLDTPLSLPAGGGQMWTPKNYGGTFSGPLTLRVALARSANIPAIRLALDVGVSDVTALARAMGVQTPLRTDPTVALGSSEVTPMDLARGYATIARMGRTVELAYVTEVRDVRGQTVGTEGGDALIDGMPVARLPGGGGGEQVLDPGVAYELADMLHEVVRAGTARRAWNADLDRRGKTGTTNNFVDAWFVGFTPRHTVAVWIGTDGTTSLGAGETGGRAALPAWIRIVRALGEEPGLQLPMPDQATLVRADGRWVPIARGHVPRSALPRATPRDEPLPAFGGAPR